MNGTGFAVAFIDTYGCDDLRSYASHSFEHPFWRDTLYLFTPDRMRPLLCVFASVFVACSSPSEDDIPDMNSAAEPDATMQVPDLIDTRDAADMDRVDMDPDLSVGDDLGADMSPEDLGVGGADMAPDLKEVPLTCSLTCDAFDFDRDESVNTLSNYDSQTKVLTIILDEAAPEVVGTDLTLSITMSLPGGGGGGGTLVLVEGVVSGTSLTYDLSEVQVGPGERVEVGFFEVTLVCGDNQSKDPVVSGTIDLEQSRVLDDFTCKTSPF